MDSRSNIFRNVAASVCCICIALWHASYQVHAGYHAMSCSTRQSLGGEHAHNMQSVASISKVMTAIVAIENADLDELVTISDHAAYQEGSSIYLQPGQIVSLRSLLYGLILRSGNDAALALADYIGGGDIDRFVRYMNEKAVALGMMNTKFTNPSGLDEDGVGNQSTPYDMSLLMCASIQYPQLREIMTTKTYTTEYSHVWSNKNRLLSLYPYTIGGKTGYTKLAGRTLITAADKEFPITIATFRIGDDFNFHRQMYERLYEDYEQFTLVSRGVYFYQGLRFQVEQDVVVITDYFNPEAAEVVFDPATNELIVQYQHAGFRQITKIKGKKVRK